MMESWSGRSPLSPLSMSDAVPQGAPRHRFGSRAGRDALSGTPPSEKACRPVCPNVWQTYTYHRLREGFNDRHPCSGALNQNVGVGTLVETHQQRLPFCQYSNRGKATKEVVDALLGPTGNLRAPTVRVV